MFDRIYTFPLSLLAIFLASRSSFNLFRLLLNDGGVYTLLIGDRRHKNIKNTLIYIDIENALFQNGREEEFYVRTAKTVEEACKLIEVGFEYVCDMDGVKIFRKRK